jgi:hypothetical protein
MHPGRGAMRLDDFVAETIQQVVTGVKTSQEPVRAADGIVNPLDQDTRGLTTPIQFDIGVTAAAGPGKKAGPGVFGQGV